MAEEKKLSEIEKEDSNNSEEENPKKEEAEQSVDKKKPKKRLKLPSFRKKKQTSDDSESQKEESVKLPEDPISPSELINDLDEDIRILEESKDETFSKTLDSQIKEVSDKDVTITLTKKGFFILSGCVVSIVWIAVLGDYVYQNRQVILDKLNRNSEVSEVNATEEETPDLLEATASAKRVRIKDASSGSDSVKNFATLLENGGYEYVEIIEDTSFEETEITIITKELLTEQYASVSAIVADEYNIASSSALLENSSDFGVVVLFPNTEE